MTVWLVGAGPGDPGLITARGLELIRACDVLVHDRLVAPELVAEAGGLRMPRHGLAQDELNRLLVALGRDRREVVRLKGGDPFVYGRGGEEAIALAEAGVPFGVVPGVSTLAAGPAAAGIPLTHRGVSGGVRVLTGRGESEGETIVVFMGLEAVADVCDRLRAEGVPLSTPAAIVARATLPDQQVAVATLGTLAAAAEGVFGPAVIVVGEVVRVRDRLLQLAEAA
ncbi:MAG TPA: uroporphyrinogen-III C-methyltransferase [Gaiellaceae bacterium]|nr:uroporphyrinogen-III C-methyltransferase [Gaiellaceae bacterium]